MRRFLIQIRRELWEHRSLWVAPLLVAALLLLAVVTLGRVQFYLGPGSTRLAVNSFQLMLLGWGIPFYLVVGIVVSVYLLDCLYGERRDRSVLFWRSMPVSDAEVVIAKLLVGLVVVPLGSYLLAALTSILASGILALRHLMVPDQFLPVWNTIGWLRAQLRMLYGLSIWLLWYAPYAAYLLLASAWARRSPWAWAFITPVLAAMVENIVFGTSYLGHVVQRGFQQALQLAFSLNLRLAFNIGTAAVPALPSGRGAAPPGSAALLATPQLWLGLLAAVLMLLLAIRLRRYRADD